MINNENQKINEERTVNGFNVRIFQNETQRQVKVQGKTHKFANVEFWQSKPHSWEGNPTEWEEGDFNWGSWHKTREQAEEHIEIVKTLLEVVENQGWA